MSRPLDELQAADFARCRDSIFRLTLPSGEGLDLTLEVVEEYAHPPSVPGRRQGFSLVFRSALPGHLRQGIYQLEHQEMGTIELFLVPIGPRDGGMRYEAVFN